jgi:multicomponent Na+:H+ antiporter subunit B
MGPMLLRTTASLLVGMLAVLSIFTLLRGHAAPGGVFAAGLILASAVAVQLLAHGVGHARQTLRVAPPTLVGIGLLTAAVAACSGPVLGRPLLAPIDGPYVPGLMQLGSVMLFDIGVYLTVAGTAVTIMFSLVEDR